MTQAATLIAAAKGYTGTLLGTAESSLASAIGAIENIGYTAAIFPPSVLPVPPPPTLDLILPTLPDVPLDLPPEPPNNLVFQDIPPLDQGDAPTFSAVPLSLNVPNKPSDLASFTASLPDVNFSSAFPNAPSLILPDAPTLVVRAEPIAPTTVLPSFGSQMPTDAPVAPIGLEASFAGAYHSAAPEFIGMVNGYVDAQMLKINPQYNSQMSAIEAQLTKYLQGGTGLNAAAENAIYERARGKNTAESRRTRDAAFTDAAARGFTLPTGALFSAMQQARQGAADNNAAAGREIVVMQAEMEQKNLQFAVTTSTGLRTAMVNATLSYMNNLGQLNGQALDYAKNILGAIVELYNLAVKQFSVRLEAYKTDASVFEIRMRAALAGIEIYKAQISALQALTQVDLSRVDVYKARIESLTAMTAMYRTQVEAVVSKASLEKLKIDLFGAQVQAYSAQVSAKNSEYQGYTAAIGGEVAKVQVFSAQAQAYNSQVNGYQAKIQAKAEVIKAAATTNDARARQYAATLSGYQAVVQARGEVARTRLENSRQQVVAFQAKTQAAIGKAQANSEYYKATAMVGIENAKLSISGLVQGADLTRAYGSSLAQLHSANATIHANLAGAAMSGMNSLAVEYATDAAT